MSVTYKLRHGVKWHDGQPFTSKDVVDTVNFFYLKLQGQQPHADPLDQRLGPDHLGDRS